MVTSCALHLRGGCERFSLRLWHTGGPGHELCRRRRRNRTHGHAGRVHGRADAGRLRHARAHARALPSTLASTDDRAADAIAGRVECGSGRLYYILKLVKVSGSPWLFIRLFQNQALSFLCNCLYSVIFSRHEEGSDQAG